MGTLGKPQDRVEWDKLLVDIRAFADVIPCGSYRRELPVCNDLDIATVTSDGFIPEEVFVEMTKLGFEIVAHGKKIGRFLRNDVQVDWYAAKIDNIGALLLHLTGSAEFNVGMRGRCKLKNMSFSENGLVNRTTKEMIAGKTEEEIFSAIGVNWVPPIERTTWFSAFSKYRIK